MVECEGYYSHYTILKSINFSLRSCEVDKVLEGWSDVSHDNIDIGRGQHRVESVVLLVATGRHSLAWSASCLNH